MRKKMIMGIIVLMILSLFAACGGSDPSDEQSGAAGDAAKLTGQIAEIDEYGHAVLDITADDFYKAGFELGDIVTVSVGNYKGDMPCFNGFYVDRDEYMVRVPDEHPTISLCINYGKFAETVGAEAGDPVTIIMKEKAGALDTQQINDLSYTDDREDYESDEVFANFRPIKEGRLYRSASPIDNERGRASYANDLIEAAGVRSVMNIASTEEEIDQWIAADDFDSPYYKKLYEDGKVIPLGLPVDFASDEFGEGIARGLTFLTNSEPPYLVHCNEGKDRAGFGSMILEELMGWNEEEITADYMTSYQNYYGVEQGSEKYDLIADKNVKEMMRSVAGLEEGAPLEGVDLKKAAEDYLKKHGMKAEDLQKLEETLK
ncbi:MAG: tyrosine-protein phosphatase [Firmicutes bacterium]|nr:tyrosine-protein phosphatase [Bacillota bacterium]